MVKRYSRDSKVDSVFICLFIVRLFGIRVERCKFMKSKKRPLWLEFENWDDMTEDLIVLMFKNGDGEYFFLFFCFFDGEY